MEYREHTGSIAVPANTGIEGFLLTVRQILKKPRVQKLTIDNKGNVTFTRLMAESEPEPSNIEIDFAPLEPYAFIRNAIVEEVVAGESTAADVVAYMFNRVAQDHLFPIAFVTGANSTFWRWYRETCQYHPFTRTELFGVPVYPDRQLPDSALVLCAAVNKAAELVHMHTAYKFEIPVTTLPTTKVDVLP